MPKTVAIGIQDFEKVRSGNIFYIDKTDFIREWWESNDEVTLITRPRRFGKTLLLNTVDRFFSNQYENQAPWFEDLSIWQYEKFRELHGTIPVIFLSFAAVKERTYENTRIKISQLISDLFAGYAFLLEGNVLTDQEKADFRRVNYAMSEPDLSSSIEHLSRYLYKYYGKKVIILLDEYDTPMQEAYVHGYWEEISQLFRAFFNATFKTNPYMDRGLMTGITRVSRESMFSDLNNLKVITTTTEKYMTAFGFTEEEVFAAMDQYGYKDREGVKYWYDGFSFGHVKSIYNPWSVINYLQEGRLFPFWSNTSGNGLAGKLIREGDQDLKQDFETLIVGGSICSQIDEQIVYGEIGEDSSSIWSLLLASGYLKVVRVDGETYELALTNYEVRRMFENLIKRWFGKAEGHYNRFIRALLSDDVEAMNHYMNQLALTTFSSFDTGSRPSGAEPERFYHGFVLGLMVELKDRYIIRSNRESGFGRYDLVLEPRKAADDHAIIIEFKVYNQKRERSLEETLKAAHEQIRDKKYAQDLIERGIPADAIRTYGFAFEGKTVLIG